MQDSWFDAIENVGKMANLHYDGVSEFELDVMNRLREMTVAEEGHSKNKLHYRAFPNGNGNAGGTPAPG